MNRPAVKAGLIGGAAAVVVSLLGLIPVCGCLSLPAEWLIYLLAGGLAAYWMAPSREAGPAAGEGAIAGLIVGAISGLIGMILAPISLALSGGADQILRQLPPEALKAFQDAGVDPAMFFGTGGALGMGALCCGIDIVIALALGALGGVIYAAVRPE